MAGYRKGAKGQGLSSTGAIVGRSPRPEPSDWNMMTTKANPIPPQQYPANFGRDASPDKGGESPKDVIDNG